jgi:hypothetical protein
MKTIDLSIKAQEANGTPYVFRTEVAKNEEGKSILQVKTKTFAEMLHDVLRVKRGKTLAECKLIAGLNAKVISTQPQEYNEQEISLMQEIIIRTYPAIIVAQFVELVK